MAGKGRIMEEGRLTGDGAETRRENCMLTDWSGQDSGTVLFIRPDSLGTDFVNS